MKLQAAGVLVMFAAAQSIRRTRHRQLYADANSILRAQVKMPDNSQVSILLPNGAMCPVGSQIQDEELHTLFGSVFKVGLRGCVPDWRDAGSKPALP